MLWAFPGALKLSWLPGNRHGFRVASARSSFAPKTTARTPELCAWICIVRVPAPGAHGFPEDERQGYKSDPSRILNSLRF